MSFLPVLFGPNDRSGNFDHPDVVSVNESFLRNPNGGAVGCVGNNEHYAGNRCANVMILAGLVDAVWPGLTSTPCSDVYKPPTISSKHEPIYEMGKVLLHAKKRYFEYSGIDSTDLSPDLKQDMESYSYLGDPTMKMWTEIPKTITANHLAILHPDSTKFTVGDLTPNKGIATIMVNDTVISRAKIVNAMVELPYQAEKFLGEIAELTVTSHNFRPYRVLLPISKSTSISNKKMPKIKSISVRYSTKSRKLEVTLPSMFNQSETEINILTPDGRKIASFSVKPGISNAGFTVESGRVGQGFYFASIKTEKTHHRTSFIVTQ